MANFLTNLLFEPKGKHNSSLAYTIKDTVMSEDGSKVYFALKDVPIGIDIADTNYWKLQIDLSESKNAMDEVMTSTRRATNEMIVESANAIAQMQDYTNEYSTRVHGETGHASGNPIAVTPDAGSLLRPKTIFEVVQEGEGDPYPAGGGKNLLKRTYTDAVVSENGITFTWDNGVVTANGTATATATFRFVTTSELQLPAGTYTLSGCPAGGSNAKYGFGVTFPDGTASSYDYGNTRTFTIDEPKYIWPIIRIYAGTTVNNLLFKPQIEEGSAATAYEPYSNIRPISGWTSAKLVRAGKNLFSGSPNKLISNGITLEKDRGSEVTVYGSAAITLGMRVFETQMPAGKYTFSIGEIGNVNRFEPCIDGTPIFQLWSGDTWTLTLEKAAAVGLNMIVAKGADCGTEDNPTRVKVQLEIGETATEYEPYQGLNLSADFGQTVYGGTLDWQKGVLTVDKSIVIFNGTEAAWVRHDASGLVYINALSNPELPVQGQGSPYGVCSHYRRTTANSYLDMGDGEFAAGLHQFSSVNAYILFKDATNGASVDAWKAYLAAQAAVGTPVQVVYKLANPTTIQLTPRQILALQNETANYIYGDGKIKIEYIKPLSKEKRKLQNLMDACTDPFETSGSIVTCNSIGEFEFDGVVTALEPKQANENLVTTQPTVQQYSGLIANFGEDKTFDALTLSVDLVGATMTASTTVVNVFNFQTASGENNYVSSSDLGLQIGTTYNKRIAITKRNITCSKVYCYFTTGGYGKWTGTVEKAKLELGETATDFVEPGASRPIIGWTGAKLTRAGKNLLPYDAWKTAGITNGTAVFENNGVTITSGASGDAYTNYSSRFPEGAKVYVNEGETITLSWEEDTNTPGGVYLLPNNTVVSGPIVNNSNAKKITYTATEGITFVAIRFGVQNANTTISYKNIQIERGIARTAFEPYQGSTYSADFGQTVYGGTLDWQKGVLTIDRVAVTLNGTEEWNLEYENSWYTTRQYQDCISGGTAVVSSMFPSKYGRVTAGNNIYISTSNRINVQTDAVPHTLDAFKELLAANPLTVVYPLSTPIKIPLIPQEIQALQGVNTFYGDGVVTVKGRQPKHIALEDRITALESALLSL